MASKRWNIFARELEDILAAHGFRLTHLDDRANIYPRKVSRLRASLKNPKSFPVLNTEEMEGVAVAFGLNEDEMLRLHAAMLSASVEQTLMDRIDKEAALLATEEIFSVLVHAMRTYGTQRFGFVAKRQ
jgi:hypothetical protein